jgi:electron transfer flavoprotein alpha/beta subunit
LCETIGGIGLIFTGSHALDTGSAVGPALAEALGMAFLGSAVTCEVEGQVVRIVRKDTSAQGHYNAFEADLPAVVTFTRDAPALRYPHGGAIIDSYRKPDAIETWSLVDLGLSENDAQPVIVERGQSFPPEREFGKETTVEEMAKIMNNEQ